MTKLILKRTNRVSGQLIQESETELDKTIDIVTISNNFLRDFPIEEVLTSINLIPKLNKSIYASLQHLTRLRHSKYEFHRAIRLLESLGQLIYSKMISILKDMNILSCPVQDLKSMIKQSNEVFQTWKSQLNNVLVVYKDVAKKRNEKLKGFNFDMELLSIRLNDLFDFRMQHEKLIDVFTLVLSSGIRY